MPTSDSPPSWGNPWAAYEIAQLRAHMDSRRAVFARQVGVRPRTVARWEEGETTATDEAVIAALDALLDPVTAHSENTCRLPKASMRRGHQQR